MTMNLHPKNGCITKIYNKKIGCLLFFFALGLFIVIYNFIRLSDSVFSKVNGRCKLISLNFLFIIYYLLIVKLVFF